MTLPKSHRSWEGRNEKMWNLTAETARKAKALCLLSCFHFSFLCFKECVIFLHIDQKALCVTCCILYPLLQGTLLPMDETMKSQIFCHVFTNSITPLLSVYQPSTTHLSVIYGLIAYLQAICHFVFILPWSCIFLPIKYLPICIK